MSTPVFDALKNGLVSRPGHSTDTFEILCRVSSISNFRLNPHSTGGGIYLLLYREAHLPDPGGSIKQNVLYAGKTGEFGQRYQGHYTSIKSADEPHRSKNHYRLARRCRVHNGTRWLGIKLMAIPKNRPDFEMLLSNYSFPFCIPRTAFY